MSIACNPCLRWLALPLIFVLAVSLPALGQSVQKDDVNQIMNPAKSKSKAETVELKELWRVGGEDDEVLFGVITDVIAGKDGNFYLLDAQLNEIQVYAPDGEHLRTIGREGEGPGEFRGAFNLLLLPNGNIGVFQAFPSKIVGLTPEGEPADAFTLPETEDAGFKMLFGARNAGKDLAVVYGFTQPSEAGFSQLSVLSLFDASASNERRLQSQTATLNGANPVFAETEWDSFRNRWTAGANGRVYSATEFGQYSIHVWNPDGKVAHVIRREFSPHQRTDAHKERVMGIYQGFTRQIPIPGMKYEIEETWNPVQALSARDDGTLWVLPSTGSIDQPEGVVGVYDVFDEKGRYTRRVTLKGQGDPTVDGQFFVKDRLFVVTDWLNALMALQGGAAAGGEEDEEAGPMEIISYELK